jgi:hypothetical protein
MFLLWIEVYHTIISILTLWFPEERLW